MNLDDHAARAVSDLRHQVAPDLDLDAARGAVTTRARRRKARHRLVVTGAAVVAVLGLMAAVAGLSGRGAESDLNAVTGRNLTEEGGSEGLSASGAAILNGLPDSPIDGKESWRLPVVADPQEGLADGDVITVYGRGFQPNDSVGIVMCTSEAEEAGVGACDLGGSYENVTYAGADEEGVVVAEVAVRQVIVTPETGEIDCLSAAERCLVAIGAIDDYDRSGGSYVNFAGAPPFPEPHVTVAPEGPYTPGQQVQVSATDLLPGRSVQVQQCVGDRCAVLARGQVPKGGAYTATVAVNSVVIVDGVEVPCDDRCVLVVGGIGVEGASKAPQAAPVPLAFLAGEPAPPVTLAPPTTGPADSAVPYPEGDVPPTTGPAGPADPGPTVPPSTESTTTTTATTLPPDSTLPPGG